MNTFGIIGSLVSALMRLIMGIVMLIIGLFRMEVALTPSWLNESMVQLDKPSRGTGSLIFMMHTHMNPVLRTFVHLVTREHAKFNDTEMNEADKAHDQRRRRAMRRWKFYLLLHQQPWLIPLRKHNLAPEYEEEEEEVKPKKGLKQKMMEKMAAMKKKKGGLEEKDDGVQWYQGGDAVPTKVEVPVEKKQGPFAKMFGKKNKGEDAVNAEETLNPIASGDVEDNNEPPEWSAHTWSTLGSDLKPKKKASPDKKKDPPAEAADEVGEAV